MLMPPVFTFQFGFTLIKIVFSECNLMTNFTFHSGYIPIKKKVKTLDITLITLRSSLDIFQ